MGSVILKHLVVFAILFFTFLSIPVMGKQVEKKTDTKPTNRIDSKNGIGRKTRSPNATSSPSGFDDKRGGAKLSTQVMKVSGKKGWLKVSLILEIEEGWMAFAKVSEKAFATATKVEFRFPENVTKIGKIEVPLSEPTFGIGGSECYRGTVVFSQMVKISSFDDRKKLDQIKGSVVVNYQLGRQFRVTPAVRKELKFSLKTSGEIEWKVPAADLFGEPEMVKEGEHPLFYKTRQAFPAPAIFDVDNDGDQELIVGDVMGALFVYEDQRASGELRKGIPMWGNRKRLTSADGKPIRVHNW